APGLGVEVQDEPDGVAVRDVHGDVTAVTLPQDDRGGQDATPRVELAVGERNVDLLRARGVDPERGERRDDGRLARRPGALAHPRPRGDDAVGVRERVETLDRKSVV